MIWSDKVNVWHWQGCLSWDSASSSDLEIATGCTGGETSPGASTTDTQTDRQTPAELKKNSIIVSNDEPDSYRHYTEGRTECNQSPITLGDGNLSCRWPCEQRNICQSDALALAQICYLWSTHMPLLSRQVYHTGRSRRVCLTCWGSIHELCRLDPHPVQYQCFRPVIWWKKPKSPKQMGVQLVWHKLRRTFLLSSSIPDVGVSSILHL